ncbi:hypothetical protein [Prevotella pallens]
MRTLRKYTTFTNETRNEQSANTPHSPTKHATNNPSGVGANSSRLYPYIIKYVYSFHKIRTFVPSYTHFYTTFRGCIRICGHDKSAPTAAYKLPKYCEQIGITQHSHNETRNEQSANTPLPPTKLATNNPQIHHSHQRNTQQTIRKYTTFTNEIRNEQSVRRRGKFIVPVSLHYQICIFVS